METVRFLQIEPTTRCNFTCGFCSGRSMEQSDLSFERFEQALALLPALRHVEIQGEGEPLMHPRFFDMVDLARRRGLRVSFITNGSWFTDAAIARILEAGIDMVQVSIESAEADAFRDIRGGKLDKVVRGIAALRAERDRRGLRLPVIGLAVTVLRSTRDHLPGVAALYERLGLDGGILTQPLQRMECYTKYYQPAMLRETLSEAELDEFKVRLLLDPVLRRIRRGRSAMRGFFEELMAGWQRGRRTCPWLEGGLFINNQGHVSACCTMEEMDRYSFGKVGVTPMPEILAARSRLRAQLGSGTIPPPCHGCEIARLAVMTPAQTITSRLLGLARLMDHVLHAWLFPLPVQGGQASQASAPSGLVQLRRRKPR